MTDPSFPFFLFVYDVDGKHGAPVDIRTDAALEAAFVSAVVPAVKSGKEVVITDSDDCCVFHAKDGTVIFPDVYSAEGAIQ